MPKRKTRSQSTGDGEGDAKLASSQSETGAEVNNKAPESKEEEESSDDDFGPARPTGGDESDSEEDVGPKPPTTEEPKPIRKKRKTLKFEQLYLSKLPNAKMYEKSFMHRSPISHICVSKTQFVITASIDGFLKFWKKTPGGIEFVKQYRAHMEPIVGVAVSECGYFCCSVSTDKTLKIYDVTNFDMINLINLKYTPTSCEWIHEKKSLRGALVAIGTSTGHVNVYKATGSDEPMKTFKPHSSSVRFMKYNDTYRAVVSVDARGMVEYWSSTEFKHPTNVKWTYKTDTDLYDFVKHKTVPTSLSVSPNGKLFVVRSTDRCIRIFRFKTGKLIRKYDENLKAYNAAQKDEDSVFKLDTIDFGRRMAVEREVEKESTDESKRIPPSNVIFDQTSNFIIYPTMLGIKVVNIHSNKLSVLMGKVENTERFVGIALFQGIPLQTGLSAVQSLGSKLIMSEANALDAKKAVLTQEDPCLFACAYKKERFYWFSRREPGEDGRDIFNEKPQKKLQNMVANKSSSMGNVAVVHTTMGDMTFVLFPKECPKTCENFITHAKDGYYNETIFHRVIKNFMVQGGDPLGDGTGGVSIWGGEFEDEFNRNLRHDRPGVLSMANAGPNTNGSQFFVTTVPCPWLNDKHTVFGRLSKGMDVLKAIEGVHTTEEKPDEDIKIINIDIIT